MSDSDHSSHVREAVQSGSRSGRSPSGWLAFLTNAVPDPSFPWATLLESFRLAYTQPRIEHWLVTYTVGLWLIVFSLPLVLLYGYQRYGTRTRISASRWLVVLFGVGVSHLTYRNSPWAASGLATWGVLAFPLGIPALYAGYRRWTDPTYTTPD